MSVSVSIIVPIYNAEKYLRKTLKCIRKQTFEDFECLLINDGSTDKSQSIIEKFCKADERFKSYYQTNEGVSSARNFGLKQAKGDYILFYDADDIIPANAVKALYDRIVSENADLVIGRMTIENESEKREYKSVKALVEKPQINQLDPRLIWNGSLCNKMFLRRIIVERNITFKGYDVGQDIIFLFEYIFASRAFVGCDELVYRYCKRFSYGQNNSITAEDRNKYLHDVKNSMQEMECLIVSYIQIKMKSAYADFVIDSKEFNESIFLCIDFIQTFYKRVVRNNIIQGIYRKIWIIDDNTHNEMMQLFNVYKAKLFDETWYDIVTKEKDLGLKEGLVERNQILNEPAFSIIISRTIGEGYVDDLLKSIYGQTNPRFEVILDGNIKDFDRNKYNYPNLYVIENSKNLGEFKNIAFEKSKGEMLVFLEDRVSFNNKYFEQLLLKYSDNIDYGIMLFKESNVQKMMFDLYKHNYISERTIREIDYVFSNKVINKRKLQDIGFNFTDDTESDMIKIANVLKGKVISGIYLNFQIDENDFLERITNYDEKMLLKELLKNSGNLKQEEVDEKENRCDRIV